MHVFKRKVAYSQVPVVVRFALIDAGSIRSMVFNHQEIVGFNNGVNGQDVLCIERS